MECNRSGSSYKNKEGRRPPAGMMVRDEPYPQHSPGPAGHNEPPTPATGSALITATNAAGWFRIRAER